MNSSSSIKKKQAETKHKNIPLVQNSVIVHVFCFKDVITIESGDAQKVNMYILFRIKTCDPEAIKICSSCGKCFY